MIDNDTIFVPLRQETIAKLIASRLDDGEPLDSVITRLSEPRPVPIASPIVGLVGADH